MVAQCHATQKNTNITKWYTRKTATLGVQNFQYYIPAIFMITHLVAYPNLIITCPGQWNTSEQCLREISDNQIWQIHTCFWGTGYTLDINFTCQVWLLCQHIVPFSAFSCCLCFCELQQSVLRWYSQYSKIGWGTDIIGL